MRKGSGLILIVVLAGIGAFLLAGNGADDRGYWSDTHTKAVQALDLARIRTPASRPGPEGT